MPSVWEPLVRQGMSPAEAARRMGVCETYAAEEMARVRRRIDVRLRARVAFELRSRWNPYALLGRRV